MLMKNFIFCQNPPKIIFWTPKLQTLIKHFDRRDLKKNPKLIIPLQNGILTSIFRYFAIPVLYIII
jgi:hypothetical protein